MCCDGASSESLCGYVIVSGEYTVSVFSLLHDSTKVRCWNLYIADSHGTFPWSQGKASVTCLTLGSLETTSRTPQRVFSVEEGLGHYCKVLFALLEEHRALSATPQGQGVVPYMTWTPIYRSGGFKTCEELTQRIDKEWIPLVVSHPRVAEEAKKFGRHPLRCFWGLRTSRRSERAGSSERPVSATDDVSGTTVTVSPADAPPSPGHNAPDPELDAPVNLLPRRAVLQ
jgi:hypothetical protein